MYNLSKMDKAQNTHTLNCELTCVKRPEGSAYRYIFNAEHTVAALPCPGCLTCMSFKSLRKGFQIFPTLEESDDSALCLLGSSSFSGDLDLMDMLCHFFLEWRSTFILKSMQLQCDTESLACHLQSIWYVRECWEIMHTLWYDKTTQAVQRSSAESWICTCAPNTSPWLCSLWLLASQRPVPQAPSGSRTASQTQCTVSYKMWGNSKCGSVKHTNIQVQGSVHFAYT